MTDGVQVIEKAPPPAPGRPRPQRHEDDAADPTSPVKRFGLIAGPAVFGLMQLVPGPASLPPEGWTASSVTLLTSALRTEEGQAALRERNPNAAVGVSAHEYGTTLDIAYTAFAPPAELPESLRVESPRALRPHLDRVAALTLESVSARKSRELQKILGDVLRAAQSEGLVLVTYERFQPVFHVTVARALADP